MKRNDKYFIDNNMISYEELEKVKELFGTNCGYSAETDLCWDIEQYIDNQIKELKDKYEN